jgi:NitT/TauT family transport system ATP-binding protein
MPDAAHRTAVIDAEPTAIRSRDVVKQYLAGRFTAVQDISLGLPEGQVTAFIGPSGCGKTTMLRLIAGLEEPTSGTIEVHGRPVIGPGPDRGMIFQAYTSFPWLTAAQNVEYGMKLIGVPPAERRDRTMALLRQVRLEDFADSYPSELSGGMKQRVAIARTLAQNPAVLLLDEPFGALDAQVRWEMQEMMIEILGQQKKTVVLVTHDIQESIYLADRIIFFTRSPGRIKKDVLVDFKAGQRFGRKEEMLVLPGYVEIEKQLFAWMREEIQGTQSRS